MPKTCVHTERKVSKRRTIVLPCTSCRVYRAIPRTNSDSPGRYHSQLQGKLTGPKRSQRLDQWQELQQAQREPRNSQRAIVLSRYFWDSRDLNIGIYLPCWGQHLGFLPVEMQLSEVQMHLMPQPGPVFGETTKLRPLRCRQDNPCNTGHKEPWLWQHSSHLSTTEASR